MDGGDQIVGFFQELGITFINFSLFAAHCAQSIRFPRVGWQAPIGSRGA